MQLTFSRRCAPYSRRSPVPIRWPHSSSTTRTSRRCPRTTRNGDDPPKLAFREVRRKRTSRSVISPRRLENHPSNQFRKRKFKSKERESEKRIYRSSHRDTRSKGRKEKFLWLKPYTIRERLSKSWTRPKSHLTISPPKPCPCAGRVAAELNRDWFLKSLVIQSCSVEVLWCRGRRRTNFRAFLLREIRRRAHIHTNASEINWDRSIVRDRGSGGKKTKCKNTD